MPKKSWIKSLFSRKKSNMKKYRRNLVKKKNSKFLNIGNNSNQSNKLYKNKYKISKKKRKSAIKLIKKFLKKKRNISIPYSRRNNIASQPLFYNNLNRYNTNPNTSIYNAELKLLKLRQNSLNNINLPNPFKKSSI